ncbi:MAG: DEAD/DEAH box helicase [archaeon]
MDKFRKLGISEPMLEAIKEAGFEKPTEIQEKSIPLILSGKDVIACSATGSGKTLAFAAAIIKDAEPGRGIRALVLTPTRELAEQVAKALESFSKHKKLEIAAIYGGLSINPQISHLRHADVVVGTPGRILDHMNRGTIILQNVKTLVLDEADRMLDMGFIDDVKKILRECPEKKQTLLFSATINEDIARLIEKHLKNPVEVAAESYVNAEKLPQAYYDTQDNQKFSLLVHLLKNEKSGLVMVFCNTRRNTDFVANNLKFLGINAMAIHGGFSQEKRNFVMGKFHSKNVQVLVCTDVAARGLDIEGISHIYNYDIPKDNKEYIHRIGRTARAGKEGKVINIVASRDYENFGRVLRDKNLNIIKEETPEIERVYVKPAERSRYRSSEYSPRGDGYRTGHSSRPREYRSSGDSSRQGGYRKDSEESGGRHYSTNRFTGREDRGGGRRFGRSSSGSRTPSRGSFNRGRNPRSRSFGNRAR